jgi:hypothetical protein
MKILRRAPSATAIESIRKTTDRPEIDWAPWQGVFGKHREEIPPHAVCAMDLANHFGIDMCTAKRSLNNLARAGKLSTVKRCVAGHWTTYYFFEAKPVSKQPRSKISKSQVADYLMKSLVKH